VRRPLSPLSQTRTHRRERVIRPCKLYSLIIQSFVQPFISDKFLQVSGTGNSDGRTAEKKASQRAFSCTSASAEGKNGNIDFAPAATGLHRSFPSVGPTVQEDKEQPEHGERQ
jgi:hypothetical protein